MFCTFLLYVLYTISQVYKCVFSCCNQVIFVSLERFYPELKDAGLLFSTAVS